MRTIVWVGLGILALNVLLIGVLASIGVIHRFQIARMHRELEHLGLLVKWPYAPQPHPIWPRWVAGFAGSVALIVTTAVMTAAPPARTQSSTAASSLQSAPTRAPIVRSDAKPGSERPASQNPTASHRVATPQASSATSSTSPGPEAGGDAGAPSAVAAVPASTTAIVLEWEPVSDASRYGIERSTDRVAWKPVTSVGGGQTGYTDGALSSGTTYYYRVVAVVDGHDASRSDVVSATTIVDTPPSPEFISATGAATAIELKWSDVDGELGYRIERWSDGTDEWTGIGTTGRGVTSYTDIGLAPATSYSYRVVAVAPDAESPPSKLLSATTDPEGPSTSEANSTAATAPADPKDPNTAV